MIPQAAGTGPEPSEWQMETAEEIFSALIAHREGGVHVIAGVLWARGAGRLDANVLDAGLTPLIE